MIKVSIKKENERIKEVVLKGHALYDDYGKDIVCAGVSSIVITTVNGIFSIDKDAIKCDETEFSISVLKDSDIVNKLLINMINLLTQLSKDYPKNIEIL